MNKFKDYDFLIGYSCATNTETTIPNTLEDVANFIVREGLKGDTEIYAPDYFPVLNTFGFFVDRCSDPEYMEALRPILIDKQNNFDRFISKDSDAPAESEETEDEQPEM